MQCLYGGARSYDAKSSRPNKARLDKKVGNSILNGNSESLQGDTDFMEECFASTLSLQSMGSLKRVWSRMIEGTKGSKSLQIVMLNLLNCEQSSVS